MKRSLFVDFTKRSLLPAVYMIVVAAGAAYLAEGLVSPAARTDLREALNLVFMFGAAPLVFFIGSAPFSASFKQRQILFIHTLPVSRIAAFATIAVASLLASIFSIGLVVAVRPSLIPQALDMARGEGVILYPLLPLILFVCSVGLLSGLVLSGGVSVLIGGCLTAGILASIVVAASAQALAPDWSWRERLCILVGNGLLSATAAVLVVAALAFRRGELVIQRTVLWRVAAVLVVCATAAVLAGTQTSIAGHLVSRGSVSSFALSPDRRALAVAEGATGWRAGRRLLMCDVTTGVCTPRDPIHAARVAWVANDTLSVSRSDASVLRTLLGWSSSSTVLLLNRRGSMVRELTYRGMWTCVASGFNDRIFVVCEDAKSVVMELLDASGQGISRSEAPADNGKSVDIAGNHIWIRADDSTGVRVFRVSNRIDEISVMDPRAKSSVLYVVGQHAFNSTDKAFAQLTKIAPLTSIPGRDDRVREYLCEGQSICVTDAMLASERDDAGTSGDVFGFESGKWRIVASGAILSWPQGVPATNGIRMQPSSMVRLRDGAIAWISDTDPRAVVVGRTRLASLRSAPSVDIVRAPQSRWQEWLDGIRNISGVDELLVRSGEGDQKKITVTVFWDFRRHSGTAVEYAVPRPGFSMYSWNVAARNQDGSTISVLSSRGPRADTPSAISPFRASSMVHVITTDANGRRSKDVVLKP